MKNNYSIKSAFAVFVMLASFLTVSAENNSQQLWNKTGGQLRASERTWYPHRYASFTLEPEAMRSFLAGAPMEENGASRQSSYIIELPMPDGSFNRYTLASFKLVTRREFFQPGIASEL